jgi:hypothetical protein
MYPYPYLLFTFTLLLILKIMSHVLYFICDELMRLENSAISETLKNLFSYYPNSDQVS